jgi:lysophospholipase L1-like esterase
MNGSDQLFGHDLTSDTTIDCDGGSVGGSVDKAYLDPLPGDSSPIGCETVVRQYPYVALGDSLSVGVGASSVANSFVRLLYSDYQASLAVNQLFNKAVSGATSTSLRNGGQLSRGVADINAPSDTTAVTIEIGGNDGLSGPCAGHWHQPSVCPFRANFADILERLDVALQTDIGDEQLTTMAFYNPSSGIGGSLESSRSKMLLGDNRTVGCSDSGTNVGLNDVIYQEAGKLGVPVANTYPAFKQHGQAYISSDGLNPNDAGHAAIAQAFRNASERCGA